MTGYTVHTGSSEDFANGWDRIFSDKKQKNKKDKKDKQKAPKAKAKKGKKK